MPGRAVAFEQVAIRPRVTGVVTAILYQPGQHIVAGTPMFRLDNASYEAAVAQIVYGDSSRESSVVAGLHEQTYIPRLQDPELARI